MPPGYIKKFLLAMRITALLLFAAFMQVSAAGLAQRLTLHQKDATLKQVFDAIHQQTGYNFVWSADQLNTSRKVDADFKDTPILEALDKCLAGTGLTYTIEEKTVIIKKKEDSLLDKAKALFAQVTITGKVTNETGEPLLGVTVRIKNSQQATTTDKNGNYTITVPDANTIIVFSFVGYETVELQAKNITNNSTIQLKASSTNLKEVLVNQGYYTRKQIENTGNVTRVDGKDITTQPISDPLFALEGKVAGLSIIQSSGLPGVYGKVQLRGQNSIANGLDPFYIVDGVPFSNISLTSTYLGAGAGTRTPTGRPGQSPVNNGGGLSPFNNLNPDDIESIEVLKDADATAIYGSRGANGVILITTKKGQAGQAKVNVSLSTGWGKVAHKLDLMNTEQYLQMRREALANAGLTPDPMVDFDLTSYDQNRYTDWQKVLIGNTAQFTTANASISGGNGNVQYLVSTGYSKQGDVFPGSFNDQKTSALVNIGGSSNNQRFHFLFSGNYVNDNNLLPTANYATFITLAPNAPAVYDANGNINWAMQNGIGTFGLNPFASLKNTSQSITDNIISNLKLDYQLAKGLTLSSSFGYTKGSMQQNFLHLLSSVLPPYNTPDQSQHAYANNYAKTWIIEPQINYKKAFGKSELNILTGGTFQQSESSSLFLFATNYSNDVQVPNLQAAPIVTVPGYYIYDYKYNALYARLGFSYSGKYFINLTGRRDGSSRFGPGRQFGNFGSAGAAWLFSEEDFAKRLSWLSTGKLRISYGTTGNDQTGDYGYLNSYSTNSQNYQGINSLKPTQLPNANFGWEQLNKFETGIELGLYKDRINLTLSYYNNRTHNQLVGYPLPLTTGFTTVTYNLPAVIQNSGLELTFNTTNIKSNDFRWLSNFNISFPQNKLISFPGLEKTGYHFIIGQPLNQVLAYHYLGIDPQTGLYTFQTANGPSSTPGSADFIPRFATAQKFFGGFQNTFTYKKFTLDFSLQFVKQNGRRNNYFLENDIPGAADANQTVAWLNRWQKTGDQADRQRVVYDYGNNYTALNDFMNSDGNYGDMSYIRLRNAILSYDVSESVKQKLHIRLAQIYVSGENLFTITNYPGLDPEIGSGLYVPPLRMIRLGIKVGF